jgi:streptogramin lyase
LVLFLAVFSLAAFAGCGGKKKSSSSITTTATGTTGTGTTGTGTTGTGTTGTGTGGTGTTGTGTGGTGTGGTGTGTGTGGTGTGGGGSIVAPDHLRNGMVGKYYSDFITLEMVGMTQSAPPCTWEIISGQLPPGLSLNPDTGEVSGTPTTRGKYIFTVKVTDDNGDSVEKQLQIIIESNDLWTHYGAEQMGGGGLRVYYIYVDSHERKWIGTQDGVYMFEGDGGAGMEWKHYTGMRGEDVHTITEDWDGNMWFGHRDDSAGLGVTVLKTDGSYDTSHNTALGRYVYCEDMLTDSRGRIWLIHYNGVQVYDPSSGWTRLYGGRSYAVAEGKDGTIWIAGDGHHNRYFGKVDPNTLQYELIANPDSSSNCAVAISPSGLVMSKDPEGFWGHHINEYDPATSSWTGNRYDFTCVSCTFDQAGNFWSKSRDGKIKKNGKLVKQLPTEISLSKEIQDDTIVVGRLGNKWMGSVMHGEGIYRYTGK